MADEIKSLEGLESIAEGVVAETETMVRHEQVRDELGRSYATGKRKDAVARVWVKPGTGKILINGGAAHLIREGERVTIMAFAITSSGVRAIDRATVSVSSLSQSPGRMRAARSATQAERRVPLVAVEGRRGSRIG